ncbi:MULTISPECIES: hypothetical protein [unclassified Chryseobacterium]|uniref:hypothetical protein n=1 Tax=unclassified Chryseobacterium TaxID=2593645 RepID=UPI00285365DC|nr:hypothetical protein [Chryseobacterium sp. CFS7]MDR4892514.1 hypothetical protein [Chryseobacterium sp. CFS7]
MFKIEFNKTKEIGVIDTEDMSVSEAIWSTYLAYEEDIIITFGNYLIYLNRKGDISVMYNDIISMLKKMKENEDEFEISFLSSAFTLYWNFKKENKSVIITPKWISVGLENRETGLFVENLRDANFPITVKTEDFIFEWNNLLKDIKEDLLKVGYTEDLENFEYLKTLK